MVSLYRGVRDKVGSLNRGIKDTVGSCTEGWLAPTERKSSGKTKPQYTSTHRLTHIIICTLTYTGTREAVGVKHVPV